LLNANRIEDRFSESGILLTLIDDFPSNSVAFLMHLKVASIVQLTSPYFRENTMH